LIELSKYNLEAGLAEAQAVAAAAASSAAAATLPSPPQSGVFAYHVLGRSLLHLAAEAAAFFALVLVLERASADGDPWAAFADGFRGWLRRLTGRESCSRAPERSAAAAKAGVGGDLELTDLTNGHDAAALQGQGLRTVRNGSAEVSRLRQALICRGLPVFICVEILHPDDNLVVRVKLHHPLHMPQEAEDAGVAAERERVLSGCAQQDAVCLARLHKRYGPPGLKVPTPSVMW
jgi:hypothetical protein